MVKEKPSRAPNVGGLERIEIYLESPPDQNHSYDSWEKEDERTD